MPRYDVSLKKYRPAAYVAMTVFGASEDQAKETCISRLQDADFAELQLVQGVKDYYDEHTDTEHVEVYDIQLRPLPETPLIEPGENQGLLDLLGHVWKNLTPAQRDELADYIIGQRSQTA